MNARSHISAKSNFRSILILILLLFVLAPVAATYAQNTKGDRAEVAGSGPRKKRIKTGKTTSQKRTTKKQPFNRVTPNRFSLANTTRSFKHTRKPSDNKKVYSQHGPFVNDNDRKPSDKQKPWRGTASGRRLVVRSATRHNNNVYPQYGPWVNNPSRKPRSTQKPVSNRATLARLQRLQSPSGGPGPVKRKKVKPRTASSSFIRHKTINANAGFWNVRRKSEVASTRDLAGRPLRKRNYQTPSNGFIAPTTSPYFGRKRVGTDHPYKGTLGGRRVGSQPRTSQRAWRGDIAGRKIRGRNFTSKLEIEGRPIFAPKKVRPSARDRVYRGSSPTGGYKSATTSGEKRKAAAALPVRVPGIGASGVGGFQGNLKGLRRPVKGGGSRSGRLWNNNGNAIQGRTPGIGGVGVGTYQGNLKGYRGPLKGGGSRSGRLWNNNGNAIQGRSPGIGGVGVGTYQGNLKGLRRPVRGGGSRSGRLWNNNGNAIQGRTPGIGGVGVGTYQGNLKGYRGPLKGGGSRSGRFWNNNGNAIQGRAPGIGGVGVGTYQGNLKGLRRPVKGGGSVSGRLWNNRESAIQGRVPGIGANGVGTYQGNLKGLRRPVKGGGSVSGRLWNNRESAIQGRIPGIGANGVGTYQGNIKGLRRPVKGGGSVSGRLWNNNQSAIPPRRPLQFGLDPKFLRYYPGPPMMHDQGEGFTGFIRAHKPLKGGGSVSGKLWNNKESAIPAKPASAAQLKAGKYQGSPKYAPPVMQDQGELFTGFIKLKRKTYIQNSNAAEASTLKKKPHETTYSVDGLQVAVKRRNYVRNKNLKEDATLKLEPTETTNSVAGLQIKVKRRNYVVNKNAADEALKKLSPTDATKSVANLQIKVRQYHYIHNPSSNENALKVREPGKAFARASDYQGNIKMKKFDLIEIFSRKNKELHPDAQFVKLNKNNVPDERDLLTNIKLWWAKTFHKNDTQPKNLKEREHKPRYDKGEQGLWAE